MNTADLVIRPINNITRNYRRINTVRSWPYRGRHSSMPALSPL